MIEQLLIVPEKEIRALKNKHKKYISVDALKTELREIGATDICKMKHYSKPKNGYSTKQIRHIYFTDKNSTIFHLMAEDQTEIDDLAVHLTLLNSDAVIKAIPNSDIEDEYAAIFRIMFYDFSAESKQVCKYWKFMEMKKRNPIAMSDYKWKEYQDIVNDIRAKKVPYGYPAVSDELSRIKNVILSKYKEHLPPSANTYYDLDKFFHDYKK